MLKQPRKRPLLVYVDTSVVGGCEDPEFADDSKRVFQMARRGDFVLLASALLVAELASAPESVRAVLESLPDAAVRYVPVTTAVERLRDAYLKAGIVGEQWVDDATHVAIATVVKADAIVSWNFRHIVRLDKIKAYNEINSSFGYDALIIVSPREVGYEGDNEEEGL